MTISTFEQLVQCVYQHLEVRAPEALPDDDEPLHGLEFNHHGMEVKLIETDEGNSPRVLVFCVFGALPAEFELEGLRKLMEINLFLGNEGNTVFGRDAESGEVNFRFEQQLARIDLNEFIHSLDQLAAQAAEWRGNFYLNDDDENAEMGAFQFA